MFRSKQISINAVNKLVPFSILNQPEGRPLVGNMSMIQTPIPPPSNEKILRQLERILNSQHFHASPQQIALLKFVVNRILTGEASKIKDYTVATEVFGRGPDFDQSKDPVVSIQASLLRRALERYYLKGGKHDPIRFNIPEGTYAPVFENRLHTQND